MLESLNNKNVLLISPKFFGYDDIIVSRLEKAGANVTLVYEDMDEVSYKYRFVNAYMPKKMPAVMNKYFLKAIMPVAEKLDYVLMIRGEFLNPVVLETVKAKTPAYCKYCMYQWDSAKNNANALAIKDFFDYVSTFDPDDAEELGWTYRPLFYLPELIKDTKEEYDVLYLCSLHSKRIEVLNRLKDICAKKGLSLYKRVYSKKIIYYKRKYLNKREGYINADNADISSKKLFVSDSYDYYNKSRIIVDYTHPGQSGFTMRTIEALGCKKKLITNNKNVLDADFYDPNNIYVYDGENVDIPDEFLKEPFRTPREDIYQKYSVDSWLKSIMNLSE